MSMTEWVEREVKLACKRENPNWDGKSFDYGCGCYQSALQAYKSLMSDKHSEMSFEFTRNILIRLLNELPLTPITDEDFKDPEYTFVRDNITSKQCPRMYSLFRYEDDNKVWYSDLNRQCCLDFDNFSIYSNNLVTDIIDTMFPITMPYYPSGKKYRVYTETFLVESVHGDYDTIGLLYCITPQEERVEINRFFKELDGKMVEIGKKEYDERKKNKL